MKNTAIVYNLFGVVIFITICISSSFLNAQNWNNLNPGAGGQIQDIVADPSVDGKYYLASDMEGIYSSLDYGENWKYVSDKLSHNRVYALGVKPNDSKTIIVGHLYGLDVSIDGGDNWSLVSITKGISIGCIAFNPLNPNHIIATIGWKDDYDFLNYFSLSENGLGVYFESMDGGLSWVEKYYDGNIGTDRNVYSIVFDSNNPGVIYIGAAKGIFKTIDSGSNWNSVAGPSATYDNRGIALTPDSRVLYAVYGISSSTNLSNIYYSLTTAISWNAITTGLASNTSYWYPEIDPRSTATKHELLLSVEQERNGLYEAKINWNVGGALLSYTWTNVFYGSVGYDTGWDYGNPNARFAHYTPKTWSKYGVMTTGNQNIFYGDKNIFFGTYTWGNRYCNPNPSIKVTQFGTSFNSYSSKGTSSTFTYDVSVCENYAIQGQGDNGIVESWDYGVSWSNMQRYLDIIITDAQSVELASINGVPVMLAQGAYGYGGSAVEGRLYAKKLINKTPVDKWEMIGGGPLAKGGIPNSVIREIAVDPKNPSRIYLSVSYNNIYCIEDLESFMAGTSMAINITGSNSVTSGVQGARKIVVDPENSNIVYFSSNQGNQGLFKGVKDDNNQWTWSKIFQGRGWESRVDSWVYDGKKYLMFAAEVFNKTNSSYDNHSSIWISTDEGSNWKQIFTKDNAIALRTNPWFSNLSSNYVFTTTGLSGFDNAIVVCYYDHRYQKGYGMFKATIVTPDSISWEDWTSDMPFAGSTQSLIDTVDKDIVYYTGTKGTGMWSRKIRAVEGNLLNNFKDYINIFPNPSSNSINIYVKNIDKPFDIQLSDVMGKIVATRSVGLNSPELIDIPIDLLNSGIYIITVITDKKNKKYAKFQKI